MVTRTVKQVSSARRVQVKEDTRHHNDLLLQTRLEEVEAVADRAGETAQVKPQVESTVGHIANVEAHLTEAVNHVVALLPEVLLQGGHFLADQGRLKHGDRGLLEGCVGAAIQVRTAGADGFDELLGAQDPGDTPAGQAEALGETVDDEDIVFVYVLNIFLPSFTGISISATVGRGWPRLTAAEIVEPSQSEV